MGREDWFNDGTRSLLPAKIKVVLRHVNVPQGSERPNPKPPKP